MRDLPDLPDEAGEGGNRLGLDGSLAEGGNDHEALAHALLERETLDQPEAYEVAGVEPPQVDAAEEAKVTT